MENKYFVDYEEHPAFRDFTVHPKDLSQLNIFTQIDTCFNEFKSLPFQEKSKLLQIFESKIKPLIQGLEKDVESRMNEEDTFKPVIKKSLQDFYNIIFEEACYQNNQKKFFAPKLVGRANAVVKGLQEQGFFIGKIDPQIISKFWNQIKPWRQMLEEKRKQKPQGMASCNFPLPLEGDVGRGIVEMLNSYGIERAVNGYSIYPLDLDYCALQLSHSDEKWWHNCYEDVGIPTSQAAYMHFDEDYSLIKAVIYLNAVSNNGPFSIISKKNMEGFSYSREAFFKRLDSNSIPLSKKIGKHSPYYRPVFSSKELRREFMKIPYALRGTSHFGDDILDHSEQARFYLEKETKVTSDLGNFVVFTGGKNVHRGGMVSEGERWVLQIGFRSRDLSLKGYKSRLKRKVKMILPQQLLSLVKKVKNLGVSK